jgi:hypothetical protein
MSEESGASGRSGSRRGVLVVCAMLLFALAFALGGLFCLKRVLSSRPSSGRPAKEAGKEKPVPGVGSPQNSRK